ncbi:hypothetical protein [Flindersiella endophytica]
MYRPSAHRRLQLARRTLGDHLALVDHGDPGREVVGLVEVLRGEQHSRTLRDDDPDDLPDLVAGPRVQPGRRLVQEQHGGHERFPREKARVT